jgi:hypothetical protein
MKAIEVASFLAAFSRLALLRKGLGNSNSSLVLKEEID